MDWKEPQAELPNDTDIVWVRVGTNYGNPFLAQYNSTNQEFTSQDSGLIIPAFMVARWSAQ